MADIPSYSVGLQTLKPAFAAPATIAYSAKRGFRDCHHPLVDANHAHRQLFRDAVGSRGGAREGIPSQTIRQCIRSCEGMLYVINRLYYAVDS